MKKEKIISEKTVNKFKLKIWQILLVVALVGGGVGAFILFRGADKDIDTAVVSKGEVMEFLVLTGQIRAVEHANLKFSSSGRIAWMGVSEGMSVNKGQALAKLDTVSLNAALQQAKSGLRLADATLERVYDDLDDEDDNDGETHTEKETRTTAEVARDNAWDSYLAASDALRNATLIAPFAGIVTQVSNPFSGVNTSAAETQIEIVNPETMYFEVLADQTEVVGLKIGQEVEVILDAYEDDVYKGKIIEVGYTPKPNEVGTVYEVKIKLDDMTNDKFRVGMTGDAKFVVKSVSNALKVPNKYVNSDKEGKFLNIGSSKKKVYIETGVEGEDEIEVKGGVKEGDVVYD